MAERAAYDVVLIGLGPASAACAVGLAGSGARVALVPGVARPRSIEADGGLVTPSVLDRAFGGARESPPLGPEVTRQRSIVLDAEAGMVVGEPEPMETRRAFRRAELEEWMRQEVRAAGVDLLEGFIEGLVLPGAGGGLRLTSEDGVRQVEARLIALCEGSDPRIAMRAGLRPDFLPEEQIHFARTRIEVASGTDPEATYFAGPWRTARGMPVHIGVVPQASGAVVSVAARIENVMRGNRSTMDALEEALTAPALASLLPQGRRAASGVELVALRSGFRDLRLASDSLVVGVDAAGAIEPRSPARTDEALRAGTLLAAHLGSRLAGNEVDTWDTAARRFLAEIEAKPSRYHDSRASGFIEEDERAELLPEQAARLGRGLLSRLRNR